MQNYILAFLLTTAGAKAEISRLEALSQIESGDNDAAIGRAGEVSRYQIMPHVWAHYSRSRAFRDSRVSTQIAAAHLQEITAWFLQRTGRPASDFDVYVLWNAGPSYYHRIGFKVSRVNPVIRERARRYASLRAKAPSARRETILAATSLRGTPMIPRTKSPGSTGTAQKSVPTAPQGPLWPVFAPEPTLKRPVPAFALTPVILPAVPPAPSSTAPYTLGAFILPTAR